MILIWSVPKDPEILDTKDWEKMGNSKALIEPFYLIAKRREGLASTDTHAEIWEMLPAFEILYRNRTEHKMRPMW